MLNELIIIVLLDESVKDLFASFFCILIAGASAGMFIDPDSGKKRYKYLVISGTFFIIGLLLFPFGK